MARPTDDPIPEWVLDDLISSTTPPEPDEDEARRRYRAGDVTPWLSWEPEVPEPGGHDG